MIENDTILSKAAARLKDLRQEQARGQQVLAQKQKELVELQQAILQIAGAIQVLEELLNETEVVSDTP